MSYVIVYDSGTGNTEALAHAVAEALPENDCLACGRFGEVPAEALEQANRVYAGFWTNRGTCTDEVAEVLRTLDDKGVFLFGTAGFGADDTYFAGVVARVLVNLPDFAHVIGTFMCQGRMPRHVRTRYEHQAAANPEQAPRMQQLIENFDAAFEHPNADDLAHLREAVKQAAEAADAAEAEAARVVSTHDPAASVAPIENKN